MSEDKPIRTAEDWIEYIKRYKQRNGSRLPVAITVPTKDFLALVNDFKQVCDSNSRRRAKIVSTTTPIAGDDSVVKKHEAIAELKSEIKRKEGVGQMWFERCMEARGENVKLKRALYKACANWALSTLAWLDCIDQGEPRKWSEMRQKCLKKAEEYK